jgi:hypothetical protein
MRVPPGTAAIYAAGALTLLLAVAAAVALALFLAVPGVADRLLSLPDNAWWFIYREPLPAGSGVVIWRLGAAIAAACIAGASGLRSLTLTRRGATPLLPFTILFLFSQSLECLRAGSAYLYITDRSIAASIILTRIIYWGRFVGLLGLLLAALYRIDLKYRRYGVLTGIVFLVSFAMAAYIPIDRTTFLEQLTWKLGDEQGVWFLNLVIGIVTVATSGGAAILKKDPRYLWFAGGLFLLLASREFLFFAVSPVLLGVGLAVLTVGIELCLRTLSVIHRQGEKT